MCVSGLDVSKDSVDCAVEGVSKIKRFPNNVRGYVRVAKWLAKYKVTLVVVESTGGYERGVYQYLWASSIATALVNPRQTRAFAYSLGRRAKNDLLDAELLMQYGKKVQPMPTEPISDEVQALRRLVGRRQQLNKMLVAEKNHLKAPGTEGVVHRSICEIVKGIRAQIKVIDERIGEIIEQSDELSSKASSLSEQTGVGPVLLSILLADMPELGKLERNQASALAGVAPFDNESGNMKGKRSIAGGRVRVRNALYMATLTAIRHNPIIRDFYKRLVSRGKPKKVAIVACMRKFIIHLNSVLKKDPQQHFIAAEA